MNQIATIRPAPRRPGTATEPQHEIEPSRPRRHRRCFPWLGLFGFLVMVAGPTALAGWYLFEKAAPRYASRAAFSIRSNEASAPLEIFGEITTLGGGSASTDAQILYDFIQSQQIVRRIAPAVGLNAIFRRVSDDPIYSLAPDAPIEDLLEHWRRMVDVAVDPATGLLTVEARAFAAEDARRIARAILAESIDLVNRLSDGARADMVRATERELGDAETRLRAIRKRLRAFRDIEQEVDPTQNARAALGLVAMLEEDRARAQVRLDQFAGVLESDAPQIRTLRRRIRTLDARISEERTRLGTGLPETDGTARPLSDVVGDYEELLVDREFAEQAYTVALANHQQAQAEARRRHRHLAVHVSPTLSEEAEYPNRPLLMAAVALLALALWAILSLIVGNIRERR